MFHLYRETCEFIERVPEIVHCNCIGATDLFARFSPVQYVKTHSLMKSVLVLGEPTGTSAWKFTENGKSTTKSFIHLIGTLHDVVWCIPLLSIDFVVINNFRKFELIRVKAEFVVLSPN